MRERPNIVIVGEGAREDALAWQLGKSQDNPQLFFAPGNAGTATRGVNLDIASTDISKIIEEAKARKAFVVVGPEAPLEKGIVNLAKTEGVEIFGPTRDAARLETSKSWAIEFMIRHNIPHPDPVIVDGVLATRTFLKNPKWKEIVIKADGLAGGKGVFLPDSEEEAVEIIDRIMIKKEFDDGSKVVFQERLKGKEVSLICITDGNTIVPLIPAQDYKRLKVGDKGPNTGGMGGFAPTPTLTKKLLEEVHRNILRPTVDGMRQEGHLFRGALYAGLMLTSDGVKVIEFNVRFGDPETQLQMPLLKSDLLPALKSATNGTLNKNQVSFCAKVAVGRVLAGRSYPSPSDRGTEIKGLFDIKSPYVTVFHSGTKFNRGRIETNGGRILTVVATGRKFPEAIKELDNSIGEHAIHFEGMQQRDDIAKKI